MLKEVKLNRVKLKISQLQEKYLKSSTPKTEPKLPLSPIGTNMEMSDRRFIEKHDSYGPNNVRTCSEEVPSNIKNTISNIKTSVFDCKYEKKIISEDFFQNEDTSLGPESGNSDFLGVSLLSEPKQDSLNQFENICFVSSSSEEYSLVRSINGSYNRHVQKLISNNKNTETVKSFELTSVSYESKQENDMNYCLTDKAFESTSELKSVTSSVRPIKIKVDIQETENAAKCKDEFKEGNSLKELKNFYSDTNTKEYYQHVSPDLTSDGKPITDLKKTLLTNEKHEECFRTTRNRIKHNLQSKCDQHRCIKCGYTMKNAAKIFPRLNEIQDSHIENPKKTLKKRLKHHKTLDFCPIKLSEKLNKDRISIQKHNTNLRPSSKRPLLKSCTLLSNSNKNMDEHAFATTQPVDLPLFLNHKLAYLVDKSGTKEHCDEMIKELLRSQIQLTRYFIESHHQMYLNYCRAAQNLCKQGLNKYSKN